MGAKFYCPHALAGANQRVRNRVKTLEFTSTVLSTLSPYLGIYLYSSLFHHRDSSKE